MKKSNVILFIVLFAVSFFLLWLWYYLGFNKVDNPFDLVLNIVWWVVSAVLIFGIVRFEKKRREQIRTIYVSPHALFNSERGVVEYDDPQTRVAMMEDILANLKYNFNKEDMPEDDEFDFKYVVRTQDFDDKDADKDSQQASADTAAPSPQQTPSLDIVDDKVDGPEWKGTVVKINRTQGNEERQFDNRQTLVAALA